LNKKCESSHILVLFPVIDRGDNQDECRAIEPLKISALNGYLASVITDQTGKGSSMCPWEITTQSGMTIVLTLIDFGHENRSTSLARATGTVCDVYAKVLEVSVASSAIMICGDAFKENVVYASTSNTVQVTIVHSPSMHYLIKFQGILFSYVVWNELPNEGFNDCFDTKRKHRVCPLSRRTGGGPDTSFQGCEGSEEKHILLAIGANCVRQETYRRGTVSIDMSFKSI